MTLSKMEAPEHDSSQIHFLRLEPTNRFSPFGAISYPKLSADNSIYFKGSNGFFETNIELRHFPSSSATIMIMMISERLM